MSQIVLCETREANVPYRLAMLDLSITTYEELCYYMQNHFLLFAEEGIPKGLSDWMKEELRIPLKADGLEERDLLEEIISCKNYFFPQEIRELMKQYDRLQKMPIRERKQKMGDEYLRHGWIEKALSYYKQANEIKQDGRICYNMGVCYARRWDFPMAERYFSESYNLTGKKQAKDALLFVLKMQKKDEKIEQITGEESEKFYDRWKEYEQQWKVEQNEKRGRTVLEELDHLKKAYRREVK